MEKTEVMKFQCPDCDATLQAERDKDGELVISVYSSKGGKPKPADKTVAQKAGEFFFGAKKSDGGE